MSSQEYRLYNETPAKYYQGRGKNRLVSVIPSPPGGITLSAPHIMVARTSGQGELICEDCCSSLGSNKNPAAESFGGRVWVLKYNEIERV